MSVDQNSVADSSPAGIVASDPPEPAQQVHLGDGVGACNLSRFDRVAQRATEYLEAIMASLREMEAHMQAWAERNPAQQPHPVPGPGPLPVPVQPEVALQEGAAFAQPQGNVFIAPGLAWRKCGVCMNICGLDDLKIMDPCGHFPYCSLCIAEMVVSYSDLPLVVRVGLGEAATIRCPTCNQGAQPLVAKFE